MCAPTLSTFRVVLMLMARSNLDASRGNRVDRRTFLGSPKNLRLSARLIFSRNHRIRSYCIVAKRRKAHLSPHSTGRRFRYAHGDLGFSLKLFQIAAVA